MPTPYLEKDKDFVEEDERHQVISELTDPEEVDAALELIEENIDTPEKKDTVSGESEPKKPEEGEDTSDKPKDKTEIDETTEESKAPKEPEEDPEKKVDEEKNKDQFVLTDEIIQKQPESSREILSKYKGKSKADMANAAAHAIAAKDVNLKGNQKVIDAISAELQLKTGEEIIQTLVVTQSQIGENDRTKEVNPKLEPPKPQKIELPNLPEDQKINEILEENLIKKLVKKYPDMPEDRNSDDYRLWEQDLLEEGGLTKANQFLRDLENAKSEITIDMRKGIYAQTALSNLYNGSTDDESFQQLVSSITEENLPRLKELNDNYRSVNNKLLEKEVETIKENLEKLGISEDDLGINLSLTKDAKGSLFNDALNPLMYKGEKTDDNVIARIGKVPLLRDGELAKKFLNENQFTILSTLVNKKQKSSKLEIERLRDETLNTLNESKNAGNVIPGNKDVKKITDKIQVKKILSDIENKY